MIIYRIPPEAEDETVCFSLIGQQQNGGEPAGEVMLVPRGAQMDACFDGIILYLGAPPEPDRQPLSAQTLLPVSFAARFSENPVYLSSQLTHGTLREHLMRGLAQCGDRLWLLIEPYCTLFPLPCPKKAGVRISRAASAILRAEHAPCYTETFCCNYCAPLPPEAGLHLYDTQDTIAQKLALAAALGVQNVIVLPLWQES